MKKKTSGYSCTSLKIRMSDITNFESHKLSPKVSNNSLDLLINGREGLADCFSLIYNAIRKKAMKTLTVCPKSLPKGVVINTNLKEKGLDLFLCLK